MQNLRIRNVDPDVSLKWSGVDLPEDFVIQCSDYVAGPFRVTEDDGTVFVCEQTDDPANHTPLRAEVYSHIRAAIVRAEPAGAVALSVDEYTRVRDDLIASAQGWTAIPDGSRLYGGNGHVDDARGKADRIARSYVGLSRAHQREAFRKIRGSAQFGDGQIDSLLDDAALAGTWPVGLDAVRVEAEFAERVAHEKRVEEQRKIAAAHEARPNVKTWGELGLTGLKIRSGCQLPTSSRDIPGQTSTEKPHMAVNGFGYFLQQVTPGLEAPSGYELAPGVTVVDATEVPNVRAVDVPVLPFSANNFDITDLIFWRASAGCHDTTPVEQSTALTLATPEGKAAYSYGRDLVAGARELKISGHHAYLWRVKWVCDALVRGLRLRHDLAVGLIVATDPSTVEELCAAAVEGKDRMLASIGNLGMAPGALANMVPEPEKEAGPDPWEPKIRELFLTAEQATSDEILTHLGLSEASPAQHGRIRAICERAGFRKREFREGERRWRAFSKVVTDYANASPEDRAMQQQMGRMAVEGRLGVS